MNQPRDAMRAGSGRELAGDRAKLHLAEVRVRRRLVAGWRAKPLARIASTIWKSSGAAQVRADKGGIALAIEVADPDGEHVMIEDRDRPGVVKAL